MIGPWRNPDEESVDLYPGLVVHDGRVTGSITIGPTRLPLWAVIGTAVIEGWDQVEYGWSPGDQFTDKDLADFLYNLLECRGEFGRLLLVLADAERREHDRSAEDTDSHFAEAHPGENICECGRPSLPPWWDDDELSKPVIDQLRRCLTALEGGGPGD